LMERTTIRAVVTMPESLFKTSGKGGTHTKVCVLVLVKEKPIDSYPIFMAEAKWCGHDSRGNPTMRKSETGELILMDDVPAIADRYKQFAAGEQFPRDRFGFILNSTELRNRILVPKYYNPEIDAELQRLSATHDLVTVGSLVQSKTLAVESGVEVGKMAYGTGPIPFIRTSDISNWEIKADFKHGVSEELYEAVRSRAKKKADLLAGDILLVRDGTYLIGVTAIVTASDLPMLYQSHIHRIRVLKKEDISLWLLFACLNAPIEKRQIKAKQITQEIINALGSRLMEIILPVPKDRDFGEKIAKEAEEVILKRIELRNRAKRRRGCSGIACGKSGYSATRCSCSNRSRKRLRQRSCVSLTIHNVSPTWLIPAECGWVLPEERRQSPKRHSRLPWEKRERERRRLHLPEQEHRTVYGCCGAVRLRALRSTAHASHRLRGNTPAEFAARERCLRSRDRRPYYIRRCRIDDRVGYTRNSPFSPPAVVAA